jgi:hypothetical protein
MEIGKATVGVVAASCITVGAAGAFLMSRSSGPAPASAPAAQVAPAGASTAGVEQSEEVVADPSPVRPTEGTAADASAARSATSVAPAVRAKREPARPASVVPSAKSAPIAAAPAPKRVGDQARASAPDLRPAAPPAVDLPKSSNAESIKSAAPEPIAVATPPAPRFVDLVVSTDSVLGLQMESSVTSERARVEDEVVARVTRDVRVGDRVAIPAGSKAHGEVTVVDRGGKLRDKARLGIRFTSVVLADGTRVPLDTETIYREGDSPGNESAAKIGGGAIGGAILGGIFGGAKGAVLGGTAGAGAGTAAIVAGGRNPATLASGTPVTVRLVKPATVTVDEQ